MVVYIVIQLQMIFSGIFIIIEKQNQTTKQIIYSSDQVNLGSVGLCPL